MIKDSTGMILRGVSIFSVRNAEYLHAQIDTIQIEDCWDEGGVKSKEEIEEGLNKEITRGEYNKLKTVLNRVVRKFQPVVEMIEKAETVGEFLGRVLKGSRKLRNIMSGRGSKKYRDFRMESIRPIRTMWEQLGVQMEDKLISNSMGIWRVRELECNIRQFAFRYNQGMVHGNTVISHFGEVDRYCMYLLQNKGNKGGGGKTRKGTRRRRKGTNHTKCTRRGQKPHILGMRGSARNNTTSI